MRDVVDCQLEDLLIGLVGTDLLWILLGPVEGPLLVALILAYFTFLEKQAQGKFQAIPKDLQDFLQPHYGLDLGEIRYAEGLNLIQPAPAITLDKHIYISETIWGTGHMDYYDDFKDSSGNYQVCYVVRQVAGWCSLRVLAHELQHSYQCKVLGGKSAAVLKYIAQLPLAVILAALRGGGANKIYMNTHELIGMEDEAKQKERAVVGYPQVNPDVETWMAAHGGD